MLAALINSQHSLLSVFTQHSLRQDMAKIFGIKSGAFSGQEPSILIQYEGA